MSLSALQKQAPNCDGLLQQLQQLDLVRLETSLVQQGGSRLEYVYESCLEPAQLQEAQKQLARAKVQWEILRFFDLSGRQRQQNLAQLLAQLPGRGEGIVAKKLIVRKQVQVERFFADCAVFRNEQKLSLNGGAAGGAGGHCGKSWTAANRIVCCCMV